MNRNPVRAHAMDGTAFAHTVKVKYTIDGKDYICRKWIGAGNKVPLHSCHTSSATEKNPLTEIQEGDLYLCLEHRTVKVRKQTIYLTRKEFDILALLIANPKRIFTYERITDLVWKENGDF